MDKLEEVKALKKLLDEGVIDEEDFVRKKSELLGGLKEATSAEKVTEKEDFIKETNKESKSLDDYEKELIEQSEAVEESAENLRVAVFEVEIRMIARDFEIAHLSRHEYSVQKLFGVENSLYYRIKFDYGKNFFFHQRSFAARTVFSKSFAIVIGPTPPGTGVM